MPRVLLIDPHRDGPAAPQQALGDAGLTNVAAVPSGSFALTMLERDRPDLIVSRAGVPDIDGYELVDRPQRPLDDRRALPAAGGPGRRRPRGGDPGGAGPDAGGRAHGGDDRRRGDEPAGARPTRRRPPPGDA